MKMTGKALVAFLLMLALLVGSVGCSLPLWWQDAPQGEETGENAEDNGGAKPGEDGGEATDVAFEVSVREFNKHGNVILETTFEALLAKNIEPKDIVTVKIGETSYDIPVGTAYSDVDAGSMICRFDIEDAKVILAINGGSFATESGMAVKETITETPGYKWNVNTDKVTLSLKEKGGYLDEYTLRHLVRTNERDDYATLSDAEYANCRAVVGTGLKANTLFRGTTPLDDKMNRDTYAMSFLDENDIATILNLNDSEAEMTAFATYTGSFYASCEVLNCVMNYDFASEAFGEKVRECVAFINENDGPYFVHCKEGKDRTGVLCAILACYLGATYDEVAEDYMATYVNFYHVEKNSETYKIIQKTTFDKTLCEVFAVDQLKTADLKAEAEAFLLATGLTAGELDTLTAKLGA